jgi:predicted peptidase
MKTLCSAACALSVFTAFALVSVAQRQKQSGKEQMAREFAPCEFVSSRDGGVMPYRLHSPEVRESEKYPLVIFLHGAGKAQGSDNVSQMVPAAMTLGSEKVQARHPSFVVLPQCPAEDSWLRVRIPEPYKKYEQEVMSIAEPNGGYRTRREKLWELAGDRTIYFPAAPYDRTPAMDRLMELIDHLAATLPVDPERIYVAGGSMGGYGAWIVAMNIPDRLAAAVPLQGCGDPDDVAPLGSLPIWIFHGEADATIPVQASRDMYTALKRAGNTGVRYTEFPGVNHGRLTVKAMTEDADGDGEADVVTWLFAQKRPAR